MKRYTRDEMLKYSKRVRNLRRKIGLSQERVAEDIRISYSTYRKIESGERNLSTEYLCRLNRAYDISADDILFEKRQNKDIKKYSEHDKMLLLLKLNNIYGKQRIRMKNEKNSIIKR